MACLGTDHTRPTREPLPTGTHRVFRLGSRSPLRTVILGSSSRRVSNIRRDLMACCSRATAPLPTGLLIALIGYAWACTPAARGADGPRPDVSKTKSRPVNFAREVRSILSDNCFACHGPDD